MVWHVRDDRDRKHAWLRQQIKAIYGAFDREPAASSGTSGLSRPLMMFRRKSSARLRASFAAAST